MALLTNRSEMQAPGVCFLCEATPPDDQLIYDSLRNFDAGVVNPLNGRKYLCQNCVTASAEAFSFTSTEAAGLAVVRGEQAYARLASVLNHVAEVAAQLSQVALEDAGNRAPLFAREASEEAEADEAAFAEEEAAEAAEEATLKAELEAIVETSLEKAAAAVRPAPKSKAKTSVDK